MYEKIAGLLHQKKYTEASRLLASEQYASFQNSTAGLNLIGVCQRGLGYPQKAISAYLRSLKINSNQSGVWTNLGNAYKDVNKLNASLQCHAIAYEMTKGKDALILHNMGITAALLNRHLDAITYFEKALELDPSKKEVGWDLARSQLAIYDYKNGWNNYRNRWECKDIGIKRFTQKEWQGESLNGKKILIYAEQGFGDYIQCIRFLKNLIELNPQRIYLEVKVELRRLLMQSLPSSGIVELIEYPIKAQDCVMDYYVSIVDLPNFFANDYYALDQEFPYLTANKTSPKRDLPCFATQKMKVGIVWSGSVTFKRNNFRAADLEYFLGNFNMPGVQLYSLQLGGKGNDLDKFPGVIPSLKDEISDFNDTAEILNELDLVISTCTSIVHLCGALNKKCWVLLDFSPHWLWGVSDNQTNWYPSVRLFRQRAPGAWADVFDNVQSELLNEVNQKGLL